MSRIVATDTKKLEVSSPDSAAVVAAESRKLEASSPDSVHCNPLRIREILEGRFLNGLKKKDFPQNRMTVFVSSTFLDTKVERDILHSKILLDLQSQFKDIDIVFYDMRFGVKDENTKDHMTWVACREAIQQCCEESDGLFFLSLQSERYGYLPLPKYLNQDILVQALKKQERSKQFKTFQSIVNEWYILDENQIPPRFELKSLPSLDAPDYWKRVLPLLVNEVFDSIAFESLDEEKLLINRSVTEWECFFGLNLDRRNCIWIGRSFTQDSLQSFQSNENYSKLTDSADRSVGLKLNTLKDKMKKYFGKEQQFGTSNLAPIDYFSSENENHVLYVQEWEKLAHTCLKENLQRIVSRKNDWDKAIVENIGIPAIYFEEILFHCNLAAAKINQFFGREELYEQMVETIKSSSISALVGKSGCGKTALMSKVAVMMNNSSNEDDRPPVIIRFCGTSQNSLDGLRLIQSISLQLLACYDKKQDLQDLITIIPTQDYKSATAKFQELILEYPVFLFIDSLDQLENKNEGRTKLSFLIDIRLNERSKIIVSSLPDDYAYQFDLRLLDPVDELLLHEVMDDFLDSLDRDENALPSSIRKAMIKLPGQRFYQCEKTLKDMNVPIVRIDVIKEKEFIIQKLLESQQRKITPYQSLVLLEAVSQEPTILYISLAMEIVKHWRSFDVDVVLKPTVKGLIHQIFETLEKNYGNEFVSAAFTMITYSREGINDVEMKDLLSLNENVLHEVFQYTTLHCFPMHVWLRLKFVVKNLMAEKESHCLRWYHRQLQETAEERYSENEKPCRQIMGKYFCNLINEEQQKKKEIHTHPLILNNISVWLPECRLNHRRVIEGYYHLVKGKLFDEAVDEICSLGFICASALCGDIFNCIVQLSELLEFYESINEKQIRAEHYFKWLKKKASSISAKPSWMTRCTASEEPGESQVKRDSLGLNTEDLNTNEIDRWNKCMITTCHRSNFFDDLETELVGHVNNVLSIAWNDDGQKIVSGSYDHSVKVWDANSGELLLTCHARCGPVNSVAWNPDCNKIASGCYDGTVKIWDALTGDLLHTLSGHSNSVASIAWKADYLVISGSADGTVRLWDPIAGEQIASWQGLNSVWSLDVNEDCKKIVIGFLWKKLDYWISIVEISYGKRLMKKYLQFLLVTTAAK
jgi:energy-coupling factor transporter ATP-binding protein EcfA2